MGCSRRDSLMGGSYVSQILPDKYPQLGYANLLRRDGRSHEMAEMGPQCFPQQKNGPSSSQ